MTAAFSQPMKLAACAGPRVRAWAFDIKLHVPLGTWISTRLGILRGRRLNEAIALPIHILTIRGSALQIAQYVRVLFVGTM